MAEREWSPALGWAKVALYVPIRMAAGLAVTVGVAWVLEALLNAVGAQRGPIVLTFLSGAAGGVLAGLILCVKLSDGVGHAGRTLLPVVTVAIVIMHVIAWHVALAIIPWAPELLLWFIGPSVSAALLTMTRFLWVEG